MTFSHPLARTAGIFIATKNDGSDYRVLAIATTLELDPKSRSYKKHFVEKLSKAATDYLATSKEVAAFVLMNRPRDWVDPASFKDEAQGRAKGNGKKPRGRVAPIDDWMARSNTADVHDAATTLL